MRSPAAAPAHGAAAAATDPTAPAPEDIYPVRSDAPWVEEEGNVVVLLPKRLDPVSRGFRAITRGPAHLRVPLDEVGSRAFLLADGSRTAGQLAEALEAEFGDQAGPRERALTFLRLLARSGVLRLARIPTEPPPPRGGERVRLASCGRCGRGFHVAEPQGIRLRCPSCGRPVHG